MKNIRPHRLSKTLKISTIIIGPLLVLVISYFAFLALKMTFIDSSDTALLTDDYETTESAELVEKARIASQRQTDAKKIAEAQGYEAGKVVYDTALVEAQSPESKANIYIEKSGFASVSSTLGTPNPDSLTYAYEAEKLYPTFGSAILIAQLEHYDSKNYAKAITYYTLSLERMSEENKRANPGDFEGIESTIDELKLL
jgi:hypothetical protein